MKPGETDKRHQTDFSYNHAQKQSNRVQKILN